MRFEKGLSSPQVIGPDNLVLDEVGKCLFEIGLSLDIIECLFVVRSEGAFASDDCSIVEQEISVHYR